MSKKHVRRSAVMCELSEENINDMMTYVQADDDVDYLSDDSFGEPNEQLSFDAIDLEVNKYIQNAIQSIVTEKNDASSQPSKPITDQMNLPSTSAAVQNYVVLDNVNLLPDSGDEMEFAVVEEGKEEEEAAASVATTSAVSRFKPTKRPRSLLPIFDKSGPNIKPNSGGFMEESKPLFRSQFISISHKMNGRIQPIYVTFLC